MKRIIISSACGLIAGAALVYFLAPDPGPPEIGDIVKHDEQDYYVTSHDYEGIEGESVLMLQLSEDPEDLDGEMVEASEVELVDRSADYVDTRLPTRYDVASTRVVVAFNTIPTGATA